jgi:hypothetical protein
MWLGNYEGAQHYFVIRLVRRTLNLSGKNFCVNIGFTPTQPTENDTYEIVVPDFVGNCRFESGSEGSL